MARSERAGNFRRDTRPGIVPCVCPKCGREHSCRLTQEDIDCYRVVRRRFRVICDECMGLLLYPSAAKAWKERRVT